MWEGPNAKDVKNFDEAKCLGGEVSRESIPHNVVIVPYEVGPLMML